MNGKELWQFQSESIKCPESIAVDILSNHFNNLTIIQHDGKLSKALLTKSDGLFNPLVVYYEKEKRILLLCNEDETKKLAEQCRKSMFAMLSTSRNYHLNTQTLLSLFDVYVGSVISCEVWGFYKGDDAEKVHLHFCKRQLGVKQSTNSAMIYMKLGRLPIIVKRKIQILKC
ncbi:unnamed protein product [Mytilus coruscus]|uniref:Uncharacterized protein n=1 Tax=Mytilus coruscus TaxID=42192 RepID=A0A6J8CE45_MYTCO|nr:unnamed protein product [Mytilus coruscus]